MTGLDIFALFILFVLLATFILAFVVLGMYPGKIARERNHPQAEAIAVCGWWGVITLGLLLPLAWIWAYTKPGGMFGQAGRAGDASNGGHGEDDVEGAGS